MTMLESRELGFRVDALLPSSAVEVSRENGTFWILLFFSTPLN